MKNLCQKNGITNLKMQANMHIKSMINILYIKTNGRQQIKSQKEKFLNSYSLIYDKIKVTQIYYSNLL